MEWSFSLCPKRSVPGKINTYYYSKIDHPQNKNRLHPECGYSVFKASFAFSKYSAGANHGYTGAASCPIKPFLLQQLGQGLGLPQWATACPYRMCSVGGEMKEWANNPGGVNRAGRKSIGLGPHMKILSHRHPKSDPADGLSPFHHGASSMLLPWEGGLVGEPVRLPVVTWGEAGSEVHTN